MKRSKKDSLTVGERALFNARLDLGRIDAARKNITLVHNVKPGSKLRGGGWVLFIKEKTIESMRENMRNIPFHSDVYDQVYGLVHHRRYSDMLVVTEVDAPGNLWRTFGDILIVALQKDTNGFYVGAASSGRNIFEIGFEDDPRKKEVWHEHDCDYYVVQNKQMTGADYAECVGTRPIGRVCLRTGKMWTCEACGLQMLDTNVSGEKLLEQYNKKS